MIVLKLFVVLAFSLYCSGQSDDEFGSAFCTCPSHCDCINAEEIDCSARSLNEIPIHFELCDWPDVTTLNISGNEITTLNATSLAGLWNLQKLYIHSNKLEKIHRQSFTGLDSLSTLDLSSNHLTSIDGRLFQSLSVLKNLYLHSNKIARISDNDLVGLSLLRLIALDDNRIEHLDANVFLHTPSVSSILLYNNKIRSLPVGIFHGLNSLLILAIHNNELQGISRGLFDGTPNIQRIYIQNNEISDISDSPFRSLENLVLMYMSGNEIQEISNSSLIGLSSLHTLVLSDNKIARIGEGAFTHTPVLQELYMDDNQVETIARETFRSLWNLRILRLGRNNLRLIEDEAFIGQRYLYGLYLFENRLQKISSSTFAGLYGMVEILLQSNYISDLPGSLFKNSRFLKKIWLNKNLIKCIDETTFGYQGQLELLDLADNEISYIPNDIFQYTPSLKYLLLSSNNISRITTRPFRNLPYMLQLAIYYNRITFIQEGSFDGTENILFLQWNVVLDFQQDNALECNCQAQYLQDYLKIYQPYYASVYCGGPGNALGRHLLTIDEIQQQCSNNLAVSIKPDVKTLYMQEGGCLRLNCRTSKAANISWSMDKGDIRHSPHDECGQLSVDECGNHEDTSGMLSIANFTLLDQGTYTCTVYGLQSNEISLSQIEMIVGDPPILLHVPIDKVYRDPPSYVIFNFQASGSPKPTIDWYYNEEKVIFNDRIHMNQNGSLIILDTEYSDNGVYKAVANNGAGKVEASASLQIYYPSACFFGTGCANGGQCIPYHQCICPDGFEGDGCENEAVVDTTDTNQPSYSGDYTDYYYYSGDYSSGYYYPDDYYATSKKRSVSRKLKAKRHRKNKLQSVEQKETTIIDSPENYMQSDKDIIKPIDVEALLSAASQNPKFDVKELLEEY